MDKWIVEIEWPRPSDLVHLPTLVGPFDSRGEADEWVSLNVPNGSTDIRQLTYPYLHSLT